MGNGLGVLGGWYPGQGGDGGSWGGAGAPLGLTALWCRPRSRSMAMSPKPRRLPPSCSDKTVCGSPRGPLSAPADSLSPGSLVVPLLWEGHSPGLDPTFLLQCPWPQKEGEGLTFPACPFRPLWPALSKIINFFDFRADFDLLVTRWDGGGTRDLSPPPLLLPPLPVALGTPP